MSNATPNYWFVVCTKPRNELKVMQSLLDLGITAYTPTRTVLRQWSDRKKKVYLPLLPSMVLVRIAEQETAMVFQVPGAVRYLFEHGKRARVQEKDVVVLQSYAEGKATEEQATLQEGDTVQVPQLNKKATVVALQGKKCLARLERLGAVVSFQLQ